MFRTSVNLPGGDDRGFDGDDGVDHIDHVVHVDDVDVGVHQKSHKHFIPYMSFCVSIWDI